MTLCFSANQALLAAKAGASYISPFVGRLDDIGHDGMELIAEIKTIYDNYADLTTEILVASIRSPMHVKQAAMIGADVVTVPPDVFTQACQPYADPTRVSTRSWPTGRRPDRRSFRPGTGWSWT